ncbi:cbb3-type cytochrome oxidase assembly protein CcoS [Bermanella marisrubri]|uniref:Cytochrome oxidase maturation protein, cbb3-type n=1 Tax=Bermanella marisrubri TaxID=207949 RepID=Q1N679_9GAMM|nr:cbb3-type cytochrome oxidase assembly protein CcoS [Bermanella marisrubri]EAT13713.1 cytochrome oxidase maturation protein, cbb3-type [Oceanobacter sp. RED65] [Bermanella marisrubri]QIZ84489.1 cbb3-type cytochrome oxidase assembly protein CcoS [Bermanella marisrubri]
MEIIFITVPVTLVFIAVAAGIFFWASKKGQFDDLDSPAHRILFDEDQGPNKKDKNASEKELSESAEQDKDSSQTK